MKNLVLLLTFLMPWFTEADVLLGEARNAKGEIVYLERHEIQKDDLGFNKFIRVEYKKPEGQIFATMTSDFSKNKFVPDTTFEDLRFGAKTVLRLRDKAVEFEEFKGEVSKSKKSVAFKNQMVASQGFDNFIRANSVKLSVKPQDFYFGVLSEKDFYTLTGYKRPSKSQDEVEYGIKVSSWLIRLFAEELRVVYDAKTLRLKSFIGRGNVISDQGKPQDVTITYQWKEET